LHYTVLHALELAPSVTGFIVSLLVGRAYDIRIMSARGPRQEAPSRKGAEDAPDTPTLRREDRHAPQRASSPLLRVGGTGAQPGAAAPFLGLRPHVGGNRGCPRHAVSRVRPRPAGPRRQRPSGRRLLGGRIRRGPLPLLP